MADYKLASPLETVTWLAAQFADRKDDDPPVTMKDFEEVQAAAESMRSLHSALTRAESFITGFEDDETQEGIADLLKDIRGALEAAGNASALVEK